MKTVLIAVLLFGVTAAAFGPIAFTGDKTMSMERKYVPSAGAIPPIHTDVPERIETATFALG